MIRFGIRLFGLFIDGVRAFGNCHSFAVWMTVPCTALRGQTPADVLIASPEGLGIVADALKGVRHAAS